MGKWRLPLSMMLGSIIYMASNLKGQAYCEQEQGADGSFGAMTTELVIRIFNDSDFN